MDQLETGGVPPDPAPMQARLSRLEDATPRPNDTRERIEARLDGGDARPRSLEQGPVSAHTTLDASAGAQDRLRRVEGGLDGTMDPLVGQLAGKPPRRRRMPAVVGAAVVSPPVSYTGVRRRSVPVRARPAVRLMPPCSTKS